jgi:hypothetical protein
MPDIWASKSLVPTPYLSTVCTDSDFFGPKWHSLQSWPFQGPKKCRFPGPTPSNAPHNGSCLPQSHYVPRHINNRYIKSYYVNDSFRVTSPCCIEYRDYRLPAINDSAESTDSGVIYRIRRKIQKVPFVMSSHCTAGYMKSSCINSCHFFLEKWTVEKYIFVTFVVQVCCHICCKRLRVSPCHCDCPELEPFPQPGPQSEGSPHFSLNRVP